MLRDQNEEAPAERIRQLLQLGAERYGVELGLLVRVDPVGNTYTIDEVSAPHPDLTRGLTGDLLSTYCRLVITEQEPLAIANAPAEGWAEDPAYQDTLLTTYVGTVVHVNGASYGTVCFVDAEPRSDDFTDDDRAFLEHLGEALGTLVERRDDAATDAAAEPAGAAVERRYRTALKHSPVLFAKVDRDLRYEWIFNPQGDLDPTAAIGKRDNELDSGPGIDQLMDLKRRTLDRGEQRAFTSTSMTESGPSRSSEKVNTGSDASSKTRPSASSSGTMPDASCVPIRPSAPCWAMTKACSNTPTFRK